MGDLGLTCGLRRYPGEGKGYPFWPGEFPGLYSSWGHKELNATEGLPLYFSQNHQQQEKMDIE